jgi:hypothetical protein
VLMQMIDDVSLEGTSLSKNLDEFVFISNPNNFFDQNRVPMGFKHSENND